MQLGPAGRPDAMPFRRAKVAKGVCANCVMTQFLYHAYPINMQIDQAGPQLLLNPMIREAFLMCGILEKSDLHIDEIDWPTVVKNWNLPVKIHRNSRNPYRMGDLKRWEQAKEDWNREQQEAFNQMTNLLSDLKSMPKKAPVQ